MVSGRSADEHANSVQMPPVASDPSVAGEHNAHGDAPGKGFFDDLLAAPQRRLESLQRSIDERIKSSVGRITGHPAFQNEVRRIERSIKKLEERLARLRREEIGSPGDDGIR